MPNITLSVDDEIIKKVRKIAIDKNTTLTAMVRQFLTSVAAMDAQEKNEAVKRLRKSFMNLSGDMGRRTWTREDLHER
jgi:DNA-binding MltR family transcriptional regulator